MAHQSEVNRPETPSRVTCSRGKDLGVSDVGAGWPTSYSFSKFSISPDSLCSASRKPVRVSISKLIFASERRRCCLFVRRNSSSMTRWQSAILSKQLISLSLPLKEVSTTASMYDVCPVEAGFRNFRSRKACAMLITSEDRVT